MWKSNDGHKQKQLFGIMNILPEKMRKRIDQSIFPLFYEEVFCKINEKQFIPLYSEKASRPNCPVNVLVGLEILKYLFTLSDERLFDHFYMDLRYKVALGIQDLSEGDISIRTLYNFRKRLVAYTEEHGVNPIQEVFEELTAHFIQKAGIETDIIRMDSTQITSNMRWMSRMDMKSRTLQQFLKGLDKEEIIYYQQEYEHYINEDKLRSYLESIAEPSLAIETIAKDMLKVITRYKDRPDYSKQGAYRLLERAFYDQTLVVNEQLQVKAGKDIASDSCQSPHNPDVTHRKKRGKGYN